MSGPQLETRPPPPAPRGPGPGPCTREPAPQKRNNANGQRTRGSGSGALRTPRNNRREWGVWASPLVGSRRDKDGPGGGGGAAIIYCSAVWQSSPAQCGPVQLQNGKAPSIQLRGLGMTTCGVFSSPPRPTFAPSPASRSGSGRGIRVLRGRAIADLEGREGGTHPV